MTKVFLFDLSYTILFPIDKGYVGKLNDLFKERSESPGYNFASYFYINEELLSFIQSLQAKYRLAMFTSGIIQNAPEVRFRIDGLFEKIFSAEEIGLSKTEPSAYNFIASDLGVKESDITFIDDAKANIDAAEKVGINVLLFKDLKQLKKELKKELSSK